MWPLNAQLYCHNFKCHQHVSATKQQSTGCLCQKYNMKPHYCTYSYKRLVEAILAVYKKIHTYYP
jgi:hypothetical protein